MKSPIKDIIQRIEKGEDLGSISKSLIPKGERELLQRCAVVRSFNEALVDGVLRSGTPEAGKVSVPFSQIVDRDFIERVPRTQGFYRLRDSYRKEYLQDWWEEEKGVQPVAHWGVPSSLKRLSQNLVSYYENLGPRWNIDKLYQLFLADQEEARSFFIQLYNEADQRFDLARCYDLIKILEERLAILAADFVTFLYECRAYFQARSLWADEYFQTANFYERNSLTDRLESLLKNDLQWILQICATGGMGKTMFLRWAIARRCVPAPHYIPCARIDFDFEDPLGMTQEPLRLFLKIANQLDQQIPASPLYELIQQLEEYTSSPQSSVQGHLINEIPDRFASALQEAHSDKPVVLIFDTLEEAIFQQQASINALVEQVARLHEKFPSVRLILSGRYDLMKRIKGFSERFGNQMETIVLEPFDQSEAKAYLKEKRSISEKRPLDTVIEKSEGNPFKLALFADILQSNPDLTETEIRAYPRIDLIYLIERVVERIKVGQVQWLLRYGVVPRRLTLSFLQDVMAKYLPPAMAGVADYDDPRKYFPTELKKDNIFPTNLLISPEEPIDLERLWRTLCQYASRYAWVALAGDTPDTLVFHGDVLNPMRREIQKHDIFNLLNRDAIFYYESKAAAEPDKWGQWIREAIYHQFQLKGAKAASYWHEQMEKAYALQSSQWRHDLATEVVGTEYVDSDGQPRIRAGGSKIINKRTLAEAYYERARAGVEIARTSSLDAQSYFWRAAHDAFSKAESLRKSLRQQIIPPSKRAFINAALMGEQGDYESAQKILEKARGTAKDTKERMDLEIEYADVLSILNRDASKHYQNAIKLANQTALKLAKKDLFINLLLKLARWYEAAEKFEKAVAAYKNALDFAQRTNDFPSVCQLKFTLAKLNLKMGRLAEARAYAFDPIFSDEKSIASIESDIRVWIYHIQAAIWLKFQEPFKALEACTQLNRATTPPEAVAAGKELRGIVLNKLMKHEQALGELSQAKSFWMSLDPIDGVFRCLRLMIEIQLQDIGNLKEAAFLLDEAERMNDQLETESRVWLQLLRARWLHLKGFPGQAQGIDRLLNQADIENWSPKLAVMIALEGLSQYGSEKPDNYLRTLITALKKVKPFSVRLTLLDVFCRCPTLGNVPPPLKKEFEKLIHILPTGALDFPAHALKIVEVFRVIGKRNVAKSILDAAETEFIQRQNLFAFREVLRARDRLGWDDRDPSEISPTIHSFPSTFGNYLEYCGAVFLEQAERLFAHGNVVASHAVLEDCQPFKFDSPGMYPAKWSARQEELYAMLELARGKSKLSKKHLERAVNFYRQLDDTASVDRLKSDVSDTAQPEDTRKQEPIHTIRIEKTSKGSLEVKSDFLGRKIGLRRARMSDVPILEKLLKVYADSSFSYKILEQFFSAWTQVDEEMTRLLLIPEDIVQINSHSFLRLEIDDPQIASIPWEYLRSPERPDDFVCFYARYFYRTVSRPTGFHPEEVLWIQHR